MSPQRKAIAFWLAVGAVGFLAIPWYALQDSILSSAWLRNYSARENAPALLQVLRHGRVWLLAIGAMLLLVAPLLAPGIARRFRARGLLLVGAAGFVILAAQGFAIGPQGWAFDSPPGC
jgi:iron(III) transport system permease protein